MILAGEGKEDSEKWLARADSQSTQHRLGKVGGPNRLPIDFPHNEVLAVVERIVYIRDGVALADADGQSEPLFRMLSASDGHGEQRAVSPLSTRPRPRSACSR
jgi:hypothetical protein